MSNLSSIDVCSEIFDIQKLQNMNLSRLKKFKTACYKAIGNRFLRCDYCGELHCEYAKNNTDDEIVLKEKEISDINMNNINKVMANKS